MWDLPRLGLEPVFPALAGGFFTTVPPGKFQNGYFFMNRSKAMEHVLVEKPVWGEVDLLDEEVPKAGRE